MKASTLHSIITARALLDDAVRLTDSEDRHLCTAGLIVLQDALELIFLALLTERGIDEAKNIESMPFDSLVGEFKICGIRVPKSGTLKALNKQRVISKHYGQLAEAATVRNYAEAALTAVEALSMVVLGKSIHEVYLTELLDEGEAKDCLARAASLIEQKQFLDALVEVRKAMFVEIEKNYSIYNWRDVPANGISWSLGKGGRKAPSYTRNEGWISSSVKEPLDYVQIDSEKLRLDAMEWGVHTSDLENVRNLTPDVFRVKKGERWHVRYSIEFPANHANKSNAHYCLDRAIAILQRKQQHERARKLPLFDHAFVQPDIFIDDKVYSKADTNSEVVHVVRENDQLSIRNVVSGFDPSEKYYSVGGLVGDPGSPNDEKYVRGFLLARDTPCSTQETSEADSGSA